MSLLLMLWYLNTSKEFPGNFIWSNPINFLYYPLFLSLLSLPISLPFPISLFFAISPSLTKSSYTSLYLPTSLSLPPFIYLIPFLLLFPHLSLTYFSYLLQLKIFAFLFLSFFQLTSKWHKIIIKLQNKIALI